MKILLIARERERESRILTNAKCLSEGVDVPSLDAIAFITRRDSKVDIIQAIGRVMRKPNDGTIKKYGYIIIPVLLDSDKLTDEIIQKNKDFKLVLSVIQALRSHDDRVDKAINIMSAGEKGSLPPHICFVNSFTPKYKNKVLYNSKEDYNVLVGENVSRLTPEDLKNNNNIFRSFLVKKIGNRLYWENWSSDISSTVKNIANKIANKIEESKDIKNKFDIFLKGLKRIINPNISNDDAINMLSQHIVVLPILKAIFSKNKLIDKNVVCQLMESMNKELPDINEEVKSLDSVYKSVEKYLLDIGESSFDRQSLIKTLFDNFFKYATPRDKDKFGIVYTPIEIVDFMINSVNDALQKEFGSSIIDKGIKILDPFTGTGTFITRLFEKFKELKATNEQIKYKYQNDVWCNEIMLLAYYISLINIEDTYNSLTGEFLPFEHDVFADTFQMYEDGKDPSSQFELLPNNELKFISKVIEEENNQEIKIIIGNPPYSVGQKNATENNQNNQYEKLKSKITETYAREIKSNSKHTLYDSYIHAFRWASDRIGESGIISFISNGGYIDNRVFEGFRREILKEFNSIYIYDLLGNFRAYDPKEGQNVFGSGCGTKVCIILLVKNPNKQNDNFIHYKRINNNLKTQNKLNEIKNYKSLFNIKDYQKIIPNKHHNWINQGDDKFEKFLPIAKKKIKDNILELSIFDDKYSVGISTSKDIWVYNFSKLKLYELSVYYFNIYKQTINEWKKYKNKSLKLDDFKKFVFEKKFDKIQWSENIFNLALNLKEIDINSNNFRISQYRPFVKKYLNFNKKLIMRKYRQDNIFPNKNSYNKVINITWMANTNYFDTLMTNNILDVHSIFPQAQSFPLFWYETNDDCNINQHSLDIGSNKSINAINDEVVKLFQEKYSDNSITHEDIFNYIYGVFHSSEYKTKYANNLKNEIPRIPYLEDFWGYSNIGKKLGDLHINYENVEIYDGVEFVIDNKFYKSLKDLPELSNDDFKVTKMKLIDNDITIVFNNKITIKNIPNEVHNYKFANRSILKWIINEYQYYEDKDFKLDDKPIVNDPNEYDPNKGGRYIFDLILSLITVSLKTQELVKQLPKYKEI